MRRVGLSATVDDPDLVRLAGPQRPEAEATEGGGGKATPPSVGFADVDLVLGSGGAQPVVEVLVSGGRVPWAGHTAEHAMAEVYEIIKRPRPP
jgi:ATP-dependent Lhr-like helicase